MRSITVDVREQELEDPWRLRRRPSSDCAVSDNTATPGRRAACGTLSSTPPRFQSSCFDLQISRVSRRVARGSSPAWLVFSLINTAYSYYWDIKHDWDLTLFSDAACGGGGGGGGGGREERGRPPHRTKTAKYLILRPTLLYERSEAIISPSSPILLRAAGRTNCRRTCGTTRAPSFSSPRWRSRGDSSGACLGEKAYLQIVRLPYP